VSTVTRYPSADTAVSGSWTNPTGVQADGGTVASITRGTTKNSQDDRRQGNFGFDGVIPSGSTINSVQIEVEHRVANTGNVCFLENYASISGVDGAVNSDSLEPTTLTARTYSAYARPGGGSWTRADLLDGTFTTTIRARNGNNATSNTWEWDYIRVTVDYTAPVMTLDGSSLSQSAAAAALALAMVLGGSLTSHSSGAAAASLTGGLVGQAASQSADASAQALAIGLTGAAASQSAGSGELDLGSAPFDLDGVSLSHSDASGDAALAMPFDAAALSTSAADAALSLPMAMQGAAASTSADSAVAALAIGLNGQSESTSAGVASMPLALALDGVSASQSSASGELDIPGSSDLDGVSASTSAADGQLAMASSLVGTAASQSAASAGLDGRPVLAGAASSQSALTGELDLGGSGALDLDGVSSSASGAVGDLALALLLDGQIASASAATGNLLIAEPTPIINPSLADRTTKYGLSSVNAYGLKDISLDHSVDNP
jgi:hypothetical protein